MWLGKDFTFLLTLVHLEGIRVIFVSESHRVKVKVTGAKKDEIPYSRNIVGQ